MFVSVSVHIMLHAHTSSWQIIYFLFVQVAHSVPDFFVSPTMQPINLIWIIYWRKCPVIHILSRSTFIMTRIFVIISDLSAVLCIQPTNLFRLIYISHHKCAFCLFWSFKICLWFACISSSFACVFSFVLLLSSNQQSIGTTKTLQSMDHTHTHTRTTTCTMRLGAISQHVVRLAHTDSQIVCNCFCFRHTKVFCISVTKMKKKIGAQRKH